MDRNKRHFPRTSFTATVSLEFTKWKDKELRPGNKIITVKSQDLSVSGIGLVDLPAVDHGTLKKLLAGDDKLRLTFHLPPEAEPFTVFARMLWAGQFNKHPESPSRCGCIFIEVDQAMVSRLDHYLKSLGVISFQ